MWLELDYSVLLFSVHYQFTEVFPPSLTDILGQQTAGSKDVNHESKD